jgi:excisionase family DNA binding protein
VSGQEDEFLLPGEAARLLHVTTKTLARWAGQRRIPCVVTPGGHHRFRRSDVEAIAKRMVRRPTVLTGEPQTPKAE